MAHYGDQHDPESSKSARRGGNQSKDEALTTMTQQEPVPQAGAACSGSAQLGT